MKNLVLAFITLLISATNFSAKTNPEIPKANNTGISFTENKGQIHDQNYKPRPDVLYGVMAGNMAVHIKKTGVSYQLYRVDSYKEVDPASPAAGDIKIHEKYREIDQQTIYRIDLNWLNHNTNFTKSEDETLPGYNNYYLESCPEGALNVRSYKGVKLNNLYNGIDLHYYEKNGELKHDYIVAPHADYKQIQIEVKGAEINLNADGTLLLNTPFGIIKEGAPLVYQNGKHLSARWKNENHILSFEVDDYDSNFELIIDPVTRLWATYYGGTGEDQARACVTDFIGNIYMTGSTISSTGTLIATVGSHQSSSAGSYDAFLVKFDGIGNRLWGTFYGGSGAQRGASCATDATGNIYISGSTSSTTGTVMVTIGSHQTSYGGGNADAYLVKFNAAGVRLWSTYYGGANNDYGSSCAVDANGNVYLFGDSNSNNGLSIATPGSHQPLYAGAYDAFLAKFNSNGVRQWGTYYGGTGQETGFSCAANATGDVYIAGSTLQGTNGIASVGSHQPIYGGGTSDGFLAKFNTNGIRQWGTYYGGSGDDRSLSCGGDASGNVYMTGLTSSNTGTVIATVGSHQQTNGGGSSDAFLTKFDANGIRQWGTNYGGAGEELGFSCVSDANGNLYLAGYTDSNTGTTIATAASQQPTYGGGVFDAFLAKFDNNGVRQWGTYYGGAGEDRAYSCVSDNNGSLYLAGYTDSNIGNAIATPGSHQTTYGGGTFDAFLVKFDVCDVPPTQPAAITGTATMCSGSSTKTYSTAIVLGANSYTWALPAGWSGSSNTNTISATPGSSGVFTVFAGNSCGASPAQTLQVTVNALPTVSISSNNAVLCAGEEATLSADGALTYTFNPGGVGTSIIITPTITSTYTVSGTDANGCSNTATVMQVVEECTDLNSESRKLSGRNHPSNFFKIYPNPTEGIINLELSKESDVIIVNALGQLVYSVKLVAGEHEINLEILPKGIYVMKVWQKEDVRNIKLIRE